jgi:pSer/pThr/pTyr-binding forkhead associated (FHA) protein
MVTSDGKSREIPIDRLPVVLGRGDDCKIRIPVASVSRRHCQLSLDDDELVVKDLKSSNGTYVNGEKVRSHELVPGDLLAIGPAVLVVRIDGHPKEVDPLESYAAGSVSQASGSGGTGAGPEAIAGVPTWSGQAGAAETAPDKPTQVSGDAKGGKDDDDIDNLLADFDFGDDEDDKGAPKRK